MDNSSSGLTLTAWAQTACALAKSWHQSMLLKSAGSRFEMEDIQDFLVDLFLERGGNNEIFEEKNRGRLHNYTLMFLQHSHDGLRYSESVHADDEDDIDEDRLQCHAVKDADPLERLEQIEFGEEIGVFADRISAIKDDKFSSVLAGIFKVTTRSGRNYSSASRREKIYEVIMQAARARGMSPVDVKKLASEIAGDSRSLAARGHQIDINAIQNFEAMFSVSVSPGH